MPDRKTEVIRDQLGNLYILKNRIFDFEQKIVLSIPKNTVHSICYKRNISSLVHAG